jgi:hypothetical protein
MPYFQINIYFSFNSPIDAPSQPPRSVVKLDVFSSSSNSYVKMLPFNVFPEFLNEKIYQWDHEKPNRYILPTAINRSHHRVMLLELQKILRNKFLDEAYKYKFCFEKESTFPNDQRTIYDIGKWTIDMHDTQASRNLLNLDQVDDDGKSTSLIPITY